MPILRITRLIEEYYVIVERERTAANCEEVNDVALMAFRHSPSESDAAPAFGSGIICEISDSDGRVLTNKCQSEVSCNASSIPNIGGWVQKGQKCPSYSARLDPATYLSSKGAEPLADDLHFYQLELPTETSAFNAALREMASIWLEAMENEPNSVKRQNRGRRAANSWLVVRKKRL